ncbi:exodeoxyribonuclease VII large subunit [Candidatus Latescibacterota bacterium]
MIEWYEDSGSDTDRDFDEKPDEITGRFTVTELTKVIKRLIEDHISIVTVEGEVSNYVHHTSGHRYFTLKDETSQLRCVMFKWQAQSLDFTPEEGVKVLAVGNVTVYEKGGQYQLSVVRLMPLGRGELLARLEELKKRLAEEGVFDNQRPIPPFPETIGVVTSPTGAALRDIVSVLSRRAPHVRIILRPALVQGDGAPADIVRGVEELNSYTEADLLIVGRGGGSIEDLWCFNHEIVARAVASSRIPVISAVGHETDFTLADFAADLRAPTPSAAAELAVRDAGELVEIIDGYKTALYQRMTAISDDLARRLENVRKGLSPGRFIQYIMLKSQAVDELTLRMKSAFTGVVTEREKVLELFNGKLIALNPREVLSRGYSLVYREKDRRVVTYRDMVARGDFVSVEPASGKFRAKVED